MGGLNPQAVEWMWRMQGGYGRVVWFPTFDADNHVRHAGTAPSGIGVVDERGAVLPVVRDILRICAAQQLVVHTGHASAEQALALIAAAREEGCDRIVVTHAQFDVVAMNESQMKKAAAMGAKMELCALGILVGPEAPLEWMRHSPKVPLAHTAASASEAWGPATSCSAPISGRAAIPPPPTGSRCSWRACRPRASAGRRSTRWVGRSRARS